MIDITIILALAVFAYVEFKAHKAKVTADVAAVQAKVTALEADVKSVVSKV